MALRFLRKKRFWIFTALIVIASIFYFILRPSAPTTPTVAVTRGNITEEVLASGQIIPAHAVQVKSQMPGVAGKIKVNEGDYVHQGEVLMTVAPNPIPAEYNAALAAVRQDQAKLVESQAKYVRYTQLVKQKVISEDDFDTVKSTYLTDLASLKQDQVKLNLLLTGTATIAGKKIVNQIKSPIDGYILSKMVEPGDNITPITEAQPGTVLFIIANMQDLEFQGQVSQTDVGALQVGMPTTLTIAALPELKLEGKIIRISLQTADQSQASQADGTTSLFKQQSSIQNGYTITVTGFQLPSKTILRAGYQATASMIIHQVQNVLLLPENAVHYEGKQAYVLVQSKQGKPQRQNISIGLADGINIEITSGLQEGDKVLLSDTNSDNEEA